MKLLFLLTIGVLLSAIAHTQGCIINYVDPTFQLTKSDPTCMINSGQLQVINQQGGVQPFIYRLIETNTINTTGLFTGLPAGNYTISSTDACGTIRTRQATLSPFTFDFTFTVNKLPGCAGGEIQIAVTPAGNYTYAVVAGTDTTWSNNPAFSFPQLTHQMQVIVKDECGNTKVKPWAAYTGFLPYISELQHNLQCDKFDIFTVAYGFINPTFCLYKYPGNQLVSCGTNPNFFNIPWGDYYVIAQDACYRDSAFHPDQRSSGGSQLDPYNWDCTTFTMHVDGMKDTVCLYNAITNTLVSCKGQDAASINPRTGLPWPSGAVWVGLPYGKYYAWIFDPCTDSTFKIDSTVFYPFKMNLGSIPGCSFTQTQLQTYFDPGSKSPFTVKIYNPDSTLNSTFTTIGYSNTFQVSIPNGAGRIMVVGFDACGLSDTAFVQANVLAFTKSIALDKKCPGLIGESGSGDISVMASTFSNVTPLPLIIKKNGLSVNIPYSSNVSDTFLFPNLESATYILQYTFSYCSQIIVYDTIVIPDYVYPYQESIQVNQCLNNPFTFTTPVVGGLSPYTYEIMGSIPSLPSIITPTQSTPAFTIGNATTYSSVTVRTVDKCGNSTIGDILIVPTSNCDRVLVVDTLTHQTGINNKLAKLYPNPSDGNFTIAFSQKKKTNYKIEIINVSGIKMYDAVLYNVDKKEYVVRAPFAPGFYLINIIDLKTGQTSTFKQIIR